MYCGPPIERVRIQYRVGRIHRVAFVLGCTSELRLFWLDHSASRVFSSGDLSTGLVCDASTACRVRGRRHFDRCVRKDCRYELVRVDVVGVRTSIRPVHEFPRSLYIALRDPDVGCDRIDAAHQLGWSTLIRIGVVRDWIREDRVSDVSDQRKLGGENVVLEWHDYAVSSGDGSGLRSE